MSKPKIYAYCPAGCKWQSVHYDDWVNSCAAVKIYKKEFVDPVGLAESNAYVLENEKKYRVFAPRNVLKQWKFTIKLTYGVSQNGIDFYDSTYTFTLPTMDDENLNYLTFKLVNCCEISEVDGDNRIYKLKIVYEMNGVVVTDYVYTANRRYLAYPLHNNYLRISEEAENVVLLNENGSVPVEDGRGHKDGVVIDAGDWENNSVSITINDFGENDYMIVNPSTREDKTIMDNANIFYSMNGNVLTLTCINPLNYDLTLSLFILRGE